MSKNQFDIAFMTVVYPAAQAYFLECLKSLAMQSTSAFDIIVFNDGVDEKVLADLVDAAELNERTTIKHASGSPASIRDYATREVKRMGYGKIIFGDSDDYFASNRVTTVASWLKRFDIVVNDVTLTDSKSNVIGDRYFSNRLKHEQTVTAEFLFDKNIAGFTNSALNLDKIDLPSIPPNATAADWYFYSVLLLEGYSAVFVNDTISYYRQHGRNVAGLAEGSQNDRENVKAQHYTALLNHYEGKNVLPMELASLCASNPVNAFVNKSKLNPLWWE